MFAAGYILLFMLLPVVLSLGPGVVARFEKRLVLGAALEAAGVVCSLCLPMLVTGVVLNSDGAMSLKLVTPLFYWIGAVLFLPIASVAHGIVAQRFS